MKIKLLLGLALVLSGTYGSLPLSRADDTNAVNTAKYPGIGDVKTVDVKIPGLNDTMFFTEQPTLFDVQMIVDGYRDSEKHTTPKAGELHRQVWLLRADGTALAQSQSPTVIGISNGGWTNDYLIYSFQKHSANEVPGIEVGVQVYLSCRPLGIGLKPL
jgi:hypothetical protein